MLLSQLLQCMTELHQLQSRIPLRSLLPKLLMLSTLVTVRSVPPLLPTMQHSHTQPHTHHVDSVILSDTQHTDTLTPVTLHHTLTTHMLPQHTPTSQHQL